MKNALLIAGLVAWGFCLSEGGQSQGPAGDGMLRIVKPDEHTGDPWRSYLRFIHNVTDDELDKLLARCDDSTPMRGPLNKTAEDRLLKELNQIQQRHLIWMQRGPQQAQAIEAGRRHEELSEQLPRLESRYERNLTSIREPIKAHLDLFTFELQSVKTAEERIAVHRRRIERLKQLRKLEARMLQSGRDLSRRKPPAAEAELEKAEYQLDGVLAAAGQKWRVLTPQRLELAAGETAKQLNDDSVLFGSPGPPGSDSRIIFDPGPRPITHLRFEALNHPSLPGGGPGRAKDGTFLLFALELYHRSPGSAKRGEYVEVRAAFADQEEEGHSVSSASDFLSGTSWIAPSADHPHSTVTAVLELEEPLRLGAGDLIAVKIDAGYNDHRTPGRVRISVAAAPARENTSDKSP